MVNAALGNELSRNRQGKIDLTSNIEKPAVNNTLKGVIPGTNSPVEFNEIKIPGLGNCAFETLNVSRDQVVEVLLKSVSELVAREELSDEIYEVFHTNHIPRTQEFEELYQACQNPNNSKKEFDEAESKLAAYCKREDVFKGIHRKLQKQIMVGAQKCFVVCKTCRPNSLHMV